MGERNEQGSWLGPALIGYVLIFLTFGIGGVWAAVTKIDRAVVASATVSIETNRKVVQHYEGGIVSEIFVKEGENVVEGQVLMRLTRIQAQATSEQLRVQLASSLAIEARLMAERRMAGAITWPVEVSNENQDPSIARVIDDQSSQFSERRASMLGQVDLLNSRIQQLQSEIQGQHVELLSSEEQIGYISKELESVRRLSKENLVPLNRLYSMERERTRLQGAGGRLTAEIAKSEGQVGEVRSQIQQLQKKFQEDVSGQLAEVRQRIDENREKLTVARDILRRVDVVSPREGSVQNLKVFAGGQVIRSGEPLLEVVPRNEPYVIMAQFSPNDIDGVRAGQQVEIRFPAFHIRNLPVMLGHLESVSRDRLVDEATKQPYFLGMISIDQAQMPTELRARIRSGMPAEVIAASGERTVMDYLVLPLVHSMRKAFIEP